LQDGMRGACGGVVQVSVSGGGERGVELRKHKTKSRKQKTES
jgi:hypothetical protein